MTAHATTPALSVNVNKVATLRNSRGGTIPSVIEAVHVVVDAGAAGVTVHPRADARHITRQDVRDVRRVLDAVQQRVEFNIEGDPRPDFIAMVLEARPDQCTLVPVKPGEITSQAGWDPNEPPDRLRGTVSKLKAAGVRVSVFVDPDEAPIRWAAETGADRIELYTEPYARAARSGADQGRASFERYSAAARVANTLGLGVNAGHDLDLDNLELFRTLPHLAEVSIGHALISRALFVGLDRAVRDYLQVLTGR